MMGDGQVSSDRDQGKYDSYDGAPIHPHRRTSAESRTLITKYDGDLPTTLVTNLYGESFPPVNTVSESRLRIHVKIPKARRSMRMITRQNVREVAIRRRCIAVWVRPVDSLPARHSNRR